MTQAQQKKILKDLIELEEMAEVFRSRAYNARIELERLSASAPLRGRKKSGLTVAATLDLRAKFKKSLIRTQH